MTDSSGTMRDLRFVRLLARELEGGRPVVLASVLATRGSMPRDAGARMALLADGSFVGTIGGGRVEQMAQERSRAVMGGEQGASIEWLTHAKTAMACGGDALVSVSPLSGQQHAALFSDMAERLERGESFVLVEDWHEGASPAFSLVGVDELSEGDPRATAENPLWDENAKTYAEPLGPDPFAYVFGAGHVGRALTPVLASVGFRVVVFDDRPEVADPSFFPQAERVILGDFKHIGEKVQVTRRDYVVVLTHGHAGDIDVLEQVAPARPAYVGCIGSRRKAEFARQTLVERGVSREWADSVHLPIGEDILAVTPSEIAVSIAAQMIRCRAELRPVRPHEHASQPVAAQGR